MPAFVALVIIFYLVADLCLLEAASKSPVSVSSTGLSSQTSTPQFHVNKTLPLMFRVSVVGMVVLTCLSLLVEPPARLPDLHAVLISTYSFVHFLGFFVVFHWLQWNAVDDTRSSDVVGDRSRKLKSQ